MRPHPGAPSARTPLPPSWSKGTAVIAHLPAGSRRLLAAVLLLTLAAAGILAAPKAGAQEPPAPPVQITDGALVWGFKASWRDYINAGNTPGLTTMSGGATVDAAGILTFPVAGGTYDPATGSTAVDFDGQVHYQKYTPAEGTFPPDYDGPEDIYLLDVTMANPRVMIGADQQVLTMEIVSRNLTTWDLVDYGRVALANLDVSDTVPEVADGITTWDGVQANITEVAANDVFFRQYRPGNALDPVSFSYTGPGGPPDVGELWAEPGSTRLAAPELSAIPGPRYGTRLVDHDRQVVHYKTSEGFQATKVDTLRAFDLRTMTTVGEGYSFPVGTTMPPIAFFDSTDGRIFFRSATDEVNFSLRWDDAAERYVAGSATVPLLGRPGAFWDPVGERAINIERRVPDGVDPTVRAYDLHEWYLHTYTEQAGGQWATRSFPLPSGPTGLNQSWYRDSFGEAFTAAAVATDGSIVLPRNTIGAEAGATPPEAPLVQRLVIGDDAVMVTEVPGTGIGNDVGVGFSAAFAGPDGQVTLVRQSNLRQARPALVQDLQVEPDGGVSLVGGRVDLGDMQVSDNFAVDPVDGTVWGQGSRTKDLVAVRDGRLRYRQYFPALHTDRPAISVGPDHTVYAQTLQGDDVQTYGFGRFERVGLSPTVTAQPESVTVSLGVGQSSRPVSFTAAAEGEPAPEVQWQAAPAGAIGFAELEGESSPTLSLDATDADDGRRFRAVFSNAAGALPSEVVELTVLAAPSVLVQLADVTVTAGADALLQVGPAGNPTPDVQWQRDDGGSWVDVPGGTDGFLTIADTTLEMSGTRYRARLANSVATVYSRAATLTVNEGSDQPSTVIGGELDWGVRASFRSYIAGPIAKGAIEVSEGASRSPEGTFVFPAESGSVAATDVAADFGGVVRFTGHEGVGTPPGVPALDVRISDIRVDTAGDAGTLVADVVSRSLGDGQLTTYDDVVFADLDLAAVTPTEVDGGRRWEQVRATLTEDGAPAFAGFYESGSELDPLTFTLLLDEATPDPDPEPTPDPTPTPEPDPGTDPTPAPGTGPVPVAPGPAGSEGPSAPPDSASPTDPSNPSDPSGPADRRVPADPPGPADPTDDHEPGSGDPDAGPQGGALLRVAGDDRVVTAAALSRASFDPGVPVAFVATPGDFADALSAGPAAAELGGPILLAGNDLPSATAEELTRLEPERIVVVGGDVAVSDDVADRLGAYTDGAVDRLGGEDRFATSAAVSAAVFDPGAPVFTATGGNFPDALAGGVAAGVAGGPVLLVGDDVPGPIRTELNRLGPEQVTVLGGVHAVPVTVEQQLAGGGADVRRVAGDDRFATAAAIADAAFPDGAEAAYVATGADYADALAGTPVAALVGAPMLLVTSDDVPAATAGALDRIAPRDLIVLGGEEAVSSDVAADLGTHRIDG